MSLSCILQQHRCEFIVFLVENVLCFSVKFDAMSKWAIIDEIDTTSWQKGEEWTQIRYINSQEFHFH